MARTLSVSDARRLVDAGPGWLALTGAGMSVDSGIPPFRGPGGLWSSLDPEVYAHVDTLERAPERAWHLFRLLGAAIARARPHAGHRALARAEREGRVVGVATQNVDGLHQAAESRDVIELHGSMRGLACHACGAPADPGALDDAALTDAGAAAGRAATGVAAGTAACAGTRVAPVPRCPCGGVLRPGITLFGETLPDGAFDRAALLLEAAGRLLVIGSSVEVWPVAGLPPIARAGNMDILVIGPEPTRLTAHDDVAWVRGTAVEVLPALFGGTDAGEAAEADARSERRRRA